MCTSVLGAGLVLRGIVDIEHISCISSTGSWLKLANGGAGVVDMGIEVVSVIGMEAGVDGALGGTGGTAGGGGGAGCWPLRMAAISAMASGQ